MNPKTVLKYAEDQGAKFVSIRFTDLPGSWQHLTFPIAELGEDQFEDGFGFDASSIRGWAAIHESDMLLVPDATRFWMDPFAEQPTLCLIGSAVDRGQRGKDSRVKVDDRPPRDEMQQIPPRWALAAVEIRHVAAEAIGGCEELRHGLRRIADDGEQRALARVCQVERNCSSSSPTVVCVRTRRGRWFSSREKSRTLPTSRFSRSVSVCSVCKYSSFCFSSRTMPPVSMSR